MLRILIILTALPFLTGLAHAESYREQQRAAYLLENPLFAELFQAADAERAPMVQGHLEKAQKGDTKAQYLVGLAYQAGMGVEADISKAMLWLEKAAAQGDLRAMYALAAAQMKSNQQPSTGKDWMKAAAEEGYAKAEAAYGARLATSKDDSESKEGHLWLEKAFAQGHVDAAILLARTYSFGFGVDRNWDKVIEWYTKAAELNHPSAQFILANEYKNGHGLPKDYEKSRFWAEKAAAQGVMEAGNLLEELDQLEK